MKRKIWIIGVLILLLLCGYSFASERKSDSNTASLSDFLGKAYENNPRILAARAEWKASIEKYPQAKALPDPELRFNAPFESIKFNDGFDRFELQLMQMIPNPWRLSLNGKMALAMAEMNQIKYEIAVRDTLTDVMKSYYELGYLDQATRIASKNRDLFAQLTELATLNSAEGKLGLSELYQSQTQLAQSEYELILLRELWESESASMRKLLGISPDDEIGNIHLPIVEIKDLDIETIRTLAIENNYELELARVNLEISKIEVSHARSMSLPDFSLGLMYDRMGSSSMDSTMDSGGVEDNFGIMLGVMLPIWGGKNKAAINEAKSESESAQANLDSQIDITNEKASKLYYKLNNSGRLVKLYRENMLPGAIKTEELALTLFENENISFSQLLENRIIVSNFELALARAEADYFQTRAELIRFTGAGILSELPESSENDKEVAQ